MNLKCEVKALKIAVGKMSDTLLNFLQDLEYLHLCVGGTQSVSFEMMFHKLKNLRHLYSGYFNKGNKYM